MGIQNKNNAMFFASGIDNSGLKEDSEEAKKIIKDMTGTAVAEGKKMNEAFSKSTGPTQAAQQISTKIAELKVGIKQTELDLKSLQTTFEKAAPGKAKLFALGELNAAKRVLNEDKIALEELEAQHTKTSVTSQRLTYQIRQLKDEMGKMALAGGRDSAAYEDLQNKAALLQRQLTGANKAMKVLANPNANFQGAISGVTGLTGALTAGMGIMGLFADENADLAKIQTRLQAVMAITIGLQQVATTLNKNSAFQLVFVSKAQDMFTSSTVRLAAALGISNVAAKVLMATLTLGLSLAIAGIIYAWDKYTTAQNEAKEAQKQSQKEMSEAINGASSTMAEQMVALYKLINRWDSLGDSLNKKKKFVAESKDEFHKLGISIDTVTQAENALVNNTGAVVKALQLRAQAAAYQSLAEDEYKKMAQASIERDMKLKTEKPIPSDYKKTTKFLGRDVETEVYDYTDKDNAKKNQEKRLKQKYDGVVRMYTIYGNEITKVQADFTKKANKELESSKITPYYGDDGSKAEAAAAKRAAAAAKRATEQANEEKVAANERSNKIVENDKEVAEIESQAELDLAQSKIDSMDEGYKKQQAQIDFNFKKQIADAKKKAEELIKIQNENGKLAFENKNPNWKKEGKVYAPITSVTQLPKDQQDIVQSDYTVANNEKIKATNDLVEKLLNKYQDYNAKMLELDKQYNDDIKALESSRTANNSDQVDKSILEAKKQWSEATSSLDFENLKKDIDWSNVFGNLNVVSYQALEKLRTQLKTFVSTEGKKLSPEIMKDVMDGVDKINEAAANKRAFQELTDGYNEYKNACDRVATAQANVNALTGGKGVVSAEALKIATKDLTQAQKDKAAAQEKMNKSIHSIASAGQSVVGAGQDIIDTLETLGVKVSDSVKTTIKGVGDVFAGMAEVNVTKPMTLIAGSIKAMKGEAEIVVGLFGGNSKGTANYERLKASLEEYMSVLDKVITKQKTAMDGLVGTAALIASSKLVESINAETESYRKLAEAAGGAGASTGSHSYAYRTNKALSDSWGAISKSAGTTVTSVQEMYNLSADQLSKIMTDNPYAWSLISSDIRTNLEGIISTGETLKDTLDSAAEALTGLSFDGARDGLDELITTADTSISDVADNFEGYMKKAVLNVVKSKYLTTALTGWYDEFTDAAKDGTMTAQETADLEALYKSIYAKGQSMYNDLANAAGIDKISKENGVTGKLQDALTEGTASEVLGVINMGTLDIRTIKELLPSHFANYATTMNNVSAILDQTIQISANTLRTANNTDGLVDKLETGLKDVKSELVEIRKNTKEYTGRG